MWRDSCPDRVVRPPSTPLASNCRRRASHSRPWHRIARTYNRRPRTWYWRGWRWRPLRAGSSLCRRAAPRSSGPTSPARSAILGTAYRRRSATRDGRTGLHQSNEQYLSAHNTYILYIFRGRGVTCCSEIIFYSPNVIIMIVWHNNSLLTLSHCFCRLI